LYGSIPMVCFSSYNFFWRNSIVSMDLIEGVRIGMK
jgi:hypothetical protein